MLPFFFIPSELRSALTPRAAPGFGLFLVISLGLVLFFTGAATEYLLRATEHFVRNRSACLVFRLVVWAMSLPSLSL